MGTAHLRFKEYPDAERAFQRALALDPRSAHAAYHLGLSIERQGRTQEAGSWYALAVAIEPGHKAARRKACLPESPAPAPDPTPDATRIPPQPAMSRIALPPAQQAGAFRERLESANLAEFWAGWGTWRHLPPWWKAVVVAFLVIPVLFVGGILLSGLNSSRTQEDDLLRQCQFALDRLGGGNLPPGCRERLGLEPGTAP